MTILAIDADIIAYQSAFVAEKEVKWDEDLWTLWSNEEEATSIAINKITEIYESYREKYSDPTCLVVLCWSSKSSFRKNLWPDYKANRKSQRKPLCLRRIKERLHHAYQFNIEQEGYEADDVIGEFITCKDPYAKLWELDEPVKTQNNRAVCVSIDKDLKTVPGLHYINNELVTITEDQANFTWMCQTIAGDTVDNISGIKGLGVKRAEKILQGVTELKYLWKLVMETYKEHDYTEGYAKMMARLTRIQRAGDDIDSPLDPIGNIF